MAITTKEIAALVGVSRQAVSAVLNGKPEKVSGEKRRKIFHIAKNMQWRPNSAALRLAGHEHTKFYGIDSGFFPPYKQSLLENLTMLLSENGSQVRLTPPGDKQHKLRVMYDYADEGAEGIFTDIDPSLFPSEKFPVPLVVTGDQDRRCDLAFDYGSGIRMLVRHLHREHGHKKMALVSFNNRPPSYEPVFRQGFETAVKEEGLICKPEQFVEANWSSSPMDRIMDLLRNKKIAAFLCTQDVLAAKLIAEFQRRGVRCPEDIAVTGCGASFLSELTPVPLTSLYLPVQDHAKNALELMRKKADKHSLGIAKKMCLTPVGLFLGGSCGCPAAELPELYWEGVPQSLEDLRWEIRPSGGYEKFRKYLKPETEAAKRHK